MSFLAEFAQIMLARKKFWLAPIFRRHPLAQRTFRVHEGIGHRPFIYTLF